MTDPRKRKLTLSGAMAQHARNKAAPGLILPRVKDHMLSQYGWDAGRDPTVIHPSEMAKDTWCLRATYLRIVSGAWPPVKEDFDFVRENIFAAGNDIHAKWQGRMRAAGFPLWGDWQCSICDEVSRASLEPSNDAWGSICLYEGGHRWEYDEVTLNARDELLIAGHADAGFDDCLTEIKSIGLGTVRMDAPDLLKEHQDGRMTDLTGLWKSVTRPLKSHLRQGDVYLHLASVLGLPFTKMVYLYEFKPNQMTKEFTITYDRERSMKLVAKAEAVKYAVDHGVPPDCSNGPGCKECAQFPDARRRTVAARRTDVNP